MIDQIQRNWPVGAIYGYSNSGCINDDFFVDLLQHFKSYTKPSELDQVLLIIEKFNIAWSFRLLKTNLYLLWFIPIFISPHHACSIDFLWPLTKSVYSEKKICTSACLSIKCYKYDHAELSWLTKTFLGSVLQGCSPSFLMKSPN